MTVCIGMICENGKCVIVASDRMTTASFPPMEFEHRSKKIQEINNFTVCLTAGDALRPKQVLDAVRKDLSGLKHPSFSNIADVLKRQYADIRRSIAEDKYLRPRGISLNDFYGGLINRLPDGLALSLDRSIVTYMLEVNFMLCGVDNEGGHVLAVVEPGMTVCFNSLGYAAIGIGQIYALSIITGSYDPNLSCQDSIKLVLKAKRASEIAPGVGTKTDMATINSKGTKYLSEEDIKEVEATL